MGDDFVMMDTQARLFCRCLETLLLNRYFRRFSVKFRNYTTGIKLLITVEHKYKDTSNKEIVDNLEIVSNYLLHAFDIQEEEINKEPCYISKEIDEAKVGELVAMFKLQFEDIYNLEASNNFSGVNFEYAFNSCIGLDAIEFPDLKPAFKNFFANCSNK